MRAEQAYRDGGLGDLEADATHRPPRRVDPTLVVQLELVPRERPLKLLQGRRRRGRARRVRVRLMGA